MPTLHFTCRANKTGILEVMLPVVMLHQISICYYHYYLNYGCLYLVRYSLIFKVNHWFTFVSCTGLVTDSEVLLSMNMEQCWWYYGEQMLLVFVCLFYNSLREADGWAPLHSLFCTENYDRKVLQASLWLSLWQVKNELLLKKGSKSLLKVLFSVIL